jgi:hypothetical protein
VLANSYVSPKMECTRHCSYCPSILRICESLGTLIAQTSQLASKTLKWYRNTRPGLCRIATTRTENRQRTRREANVMNELIALNSFHFPLFPITRSYCHHRFSKQRAVGLATDLHIHIKYHLPGTLVLRVSPLLPNFFPAHQDTPQFLAGCDGAQNGTSPNPVIAIRSSQFLACRRPSRSLRRHSRRPGPPNNPEIAGVLNLLARTFQSLVAWPILMRNVLRMRYITSPAIL